MMVSEERLREVGLIGQRMGGESEQLAIHWAGVVYERWEEVMRTHVFTPDKSSIPEGAEIVGIPSYLRGWPGDGWYYRKRG